MNSESPRQSVKARRKLKDEGGVAYKYSMAIKQQREMMRPATSPSAAHGGFMADDMDQILATTFSSTGGSTGPHGGLPMLSESNSADSIIRRVEMEIAAARRAASGFSSPNSSARIIEKNDDEFNEDEMADMANILNTQSNSIESHDYEGDDMRPDVLQMQMSSDSSKDRALDIIRDEFQADLDKEEAKASQSVSHIPNLMSSGPEGPNSRNSSFASCVSMDSPTSKSEQNLPVDMAKPMIPASSDGSFVRNQVGRLDASSPMEFTPSEEKKVDSPVPRSASSPVANQQTSASRTGRPRRSQGEEKDANVAFLIESEPKDELISGNNEIECPADETKENADADGSLYDPRTPRSTVSTPDRPHRTPTPSSKAPTRDNSLNATSPREPEGNYAASPRTPPTFAQRSRTTRPSPRQVGMTRTRELLDNLKEQRESISNRNTPAASTTASEASTAVIRNPREPSSLNAHFTRAARAKEMMRTSLRSNRKEVDPTPPAKEGKPSEEPIPSPSKDAMNVAKRVTIQSPEDFAPELSRERTLESPRRSAREVAESISRQSSKIRFRNPFPVIKPPTVRRDAEAIIADHSMGLPDMPVRWVRPKKELRQLIVAAMGTSLPRRSNACGALKVLTKNKKNQMTLVRTDGFLGALIFAASQSASNADRDLAIDARTRAVSCLKNVCDPKDNRVIVFNHPGMVECLVKVIKCDSGAGRAMAAAALALLAKTPGCREGLARSEDVIDVLAKVLKGVGVLLEEEEICCPSPRATSSRKLDDDVSAYSDRSRKQHEDGTDEDESDENDSLSETSSIASSRRTGPPVDVLGLRDIKQVDSIKTQTEERQSEFVLLSRSNACAALLHLSKHCAISVSFNKSISTRDGKHLALTVYHSLCRFSAIALYQPRVARQSLDSVTRNNESNPHKVP